MKKHLTFDERVTIQEGLRKRLTFTQIAKEMGRSRSTISREVNLRMTIIEPKKNLCIHRKECNLPFECKYRDCKTPLNCSITCSKCIEGCEKYEEDICKMSRYYPKGCNICNIHRCKYRKMIYDAKAAQKMYENTLSESRKGISLSEEEFQYLDNTVVKLVKNGLSIPIIHREHITEMPVSERTIYNYLEHGLFSMDNLELRRKMRRKERKKSGPVLKVDKKCHKDRSYEDYLQYITDNPDASVTQLDSVVGSPGGKVLLTAYLTNCGLQLMYIRDRNTAKSVAEVFQNLRNGLGYERFASIFQVLLSDRGSEFTDPSSIEVNSETGEIECRLFYCDPMNSNQKSGCERNHELIRYIIPKGKSMDSYDQTDINKMMNHINSYPRKKWNGKAPIDVFISLYGEETATLLGLERIQSDSIILKPKLLKK